ncbi:MAG: PD40 domain-containing protein [Actinobacteria bacterium]|nr:PD40 domain-containing protein [Actinomycetota bacterium]
MRSIATAILAVAVALALAMSARAAFPGERGLIAFVSHRDGNAEIYTMNRDGSNQTNITRAPASDYAPAFSPDGRTIAFVTTRDGNPEIYTMAADGSGANRLTDNATSDSDPAFSPDGQRIAFVRTPPPSPFPGRPVNEIFTMASDGSNLTRLTDKTADADPTYSPDGLRIAFSRNVFRHFQLHTMTADGSGQTNITASTGSCGQFIDELGPAFSPDGERIAFASNREDLAGPCFSTNFEIYTGAPDGSDVTRLTNNAASDTQPDWQSIPSRPVPPPTDPVSGEECKHGQFRQLGFTSQGQCVKAANRAAKARESLP